MTSRLFFSALRAALPGPFAVVPLLALPLALLALGCNPPDPVWDLPCDQRPERSVTPGTGETEFHLIEAQPLSIQYGNQGGQHIWMGVRTVGFGPDASATFGIFGASDSTIVYSGPNTEHLELHYNGDADASEAYGLYGYLDSRDSFESDVSPAGEKVIFWADVSDDCGVTTHGETAATVE